MQVRIICGICSNIYIDDDWIETTLPIVQLCDTCQKKWDEVNK